MFISHKQSQFHINHNSIYHYYTKCQSVSNEKWLKRDKTGYGIMHFKYRHKYHNLNFYIYVIIYV